MGERTSNEMGNLSLQTKNRIPRDLLQRFMVGTDPRGSNPEDDTGEELELNLGLSLGGRFGVDKSSNKLVRSSSIATILPVVRDDDVLGGSGSQGKTGPGGSYSSLIRTSSLPVETEEEWRKRKELQSLRRLAAKRRRSEKQRNLPAPEIGRVGSPAGLSPGSGNWVSGGAAKQSSLTGAGGSGVEALIGKGTVYSGVAAAVPSPATGSGTGAGSGGFTQPSSQGSVESQASSMSEFESRHLQGSSSGGEVSPVSMQSVQERIGQDATGPSGSKAVEPAVRPSRPESENPSKNRGKEIGLNNVDMPCVFTQGDGPNGRRIEGILYKYGKGEEVKIMCVCHGSFLSPAEFVKHAGGTDVVHPLKHIVVNPNSSSYL